MCYQSGPVACTAVGYLSSCLLKCDKALTLTVPHCPLLSKVSRPGSDLEDRLKIFFYVSWSLVSYCKCLGLGRGWSPLRYLGLGLGLRQSLFQKGSGRGLYCNTDSNQPACTYLMFCINIFIAGASGCK